MMSNQEVNFLDDNPPRDFNGTTLQLTGNKSPQLDQISENEKDRLSNKRDVALLPWYGENSQDFFSCRSEIIEKAIKDCTSQLLTQEDGELLGSWLLTEISLWDNEKERLVVLTTNVTLTIKYDFIAMKILDTQRVPVTNIDTIVIGDLEYPPHSLVPRLNGLVTGVSEVVKGCLVRPLHNRFSPTSSAPADANANPLDLVNFEPKSRNLRGLRIMWNQGQPLAFSKKWNPFSSNIPWNTYTSHPLFWHKDADAQESRLFNVNDFAYTLIERACANSNTVVEHKPILLENYVGLGSLIYNKNALGFYKVRGKVSF